MLPIPAVLQERFDACLRAGAVPEGTRVYYKKWLRFYLDFCQKYQAAPSQRKSLPLFLKKLQEKKQSERQQQQAADAVSLYYELVQASGHENYFSPHPGPFPQQGEGVGANPTVSTRNRAAPPTGSSSNPAETTDIAVSQFKTTQQPPPAAAASSVSKPESMTGASWKAEFTGLTEEIRIRHYSPKTLKTYRQWLRHFQTFTRSKQPDFLTAADVKEFLTWLAVKREVSASTQNQAFNALLFFYRHVLHRDFGKVEGVVRAKRRPYIPVVLSREEINTILSHLAPPSGMWGRNDRN